MCNWGVQVECEGLVTLVKSGRNECHSRPISEYFINLLECRNIFFYLDAVEWVTGITMRANHALLAK